MSDGALPNPLLSVDMLIEEFSSLRLKPLLSKKCCLFRPASSIARFSSLDSSDGLQLMTGLRSRPATGTFLLLSNSSGVMSWPETKF